MNLLYMEKEFNKSPFRPSIKAEQDFAKKTGKSVDEVKKFLLKQPIYQIYLPPPKYIPMPNAAFKSSLNLNEIHQADILYLPHDGNYKYALTIVDIATRYKCAIPLKNKTAKATKEGFDIAYTNVLKPPNQLQVDKGKEFLGGLDKHFPNTKIITGGKTLVSVVERFNRTLAEHIFLHQYFNEVDSKDRDTKWVDRLPNILRDLNNKYTRLIKMSPNDAVKKQFDIKQYSSKPIPQNYKPLSKLHVGDKVRYLYRNGEAENDTKKRATDPNWSLTTYKIKKVVRDPKFDYYYLDTPLDYLADRHFLREQLQFIS